MNQTKARSHGFRASLVRFFERGVWPAILVAGLLMPPGTAIPAGAGAAPGASSAPLGLPERVACRQAVEQVFWQHRLWPEQNPGAKPPLSAVLPPATLAARVADEMLLAQALAVYWNQPVTGAQVQAEIERMARDTRQPRVLHELWQALGNDPLLVAECLARPALVERLVHERYDYDAQIHGALHRNAEAALAAQPAPGGWQALAAQGAVYSEVEWVKGDASESAGDGSIAIHSAEWEDHLASLAARLGAAGTPPVGRASALQEDPRRFYAFAVLALDGDRLRMATVEWRKQTFDAWWQRARSGLSPAAGGETQAYAYRLPEIRSEAPGDYAWTPTAGLPEGAGSAVWTGSEMIVWGGGNGLGGKLNSGSRYNPATDTWKATAAVGAPYPRNAHTAVWTGTEMIVWGGCALGDEHNCAINSGGRYNPSSETWAPTSLTNAPSIRFGHTAVWTGSRMLVWGGCRQINDACNPSATGSTGGVYDPAADSWTATNTAGAPTPRYGHTAVWTGSRMIVWGGNTGSATLNSGGLYDPAAGTWQATALAGVPSERYQHTVVWTGSAMIVWGGCPSVFCYGGSLPIGTGARYNPSTDTWAATNDSGAPSARYLHTAVWTGQRMVVWGGSSVTASLNTGARYDPVTDTWTAVTQSGAPTPRANHLAVWTGTLMIVWGGAPDKTGGRYDPVADVWTPTNREDPFSFRARHTAVWTGSEMIVWGGDDAASGSSFGLGLRYNPALASWTPTSTAGEPWGRIAHTAIWTGSEMIVWGGQYGNIPFNDGGRYNPASDTWSATTLTGAPEEKAWHSAVWTGSEMIVWGGAGNTYYQNSGGRYRPDTNTWAAVTTAGAPIGRYLHTAVWTGGEMVVWGGVSATGETNTGGRYTPGTDAWQPVSTSGAPEARHFQTALWTGTRMWVWGGKTGDYSGGTLFNSGGLYDPAADTWQATSQANAPTARFYHSAVWTGGEVIVWGGCSAPGCYQMESTGGHYDPSTNTWTGATPLRLAPSARSLHSTVWTGTSMIVWGGEVRDVGTYTTTGGEYRLVPVLDFRVYLPVAAR